MAFLDNSGDIILDAVLTDAGRQRMARGEFKIVKFALGDEEINYELFNSTHPSGSAFSDLEIMQTPVLEAFTNNASSMKTKLVSVNRNNILYLPIFKIGNNAAVSQNNLQNTNAATYSGYDGFYVIADQSTADYLNTNVLTRKDGVLMGVSGVGAQGANDEKFIAIDQGLDTGGSPPTSLLMPQDLQETSYLIQVDHRLLRLLGREPSGVKSVLSNSFVDDDSIATYYISAGSPYCIGDRGSAIRMQHVSNEEAQRNNAALSEVFLGPVGPRLMLYLRGSLNVQTSDALFDELGTSATGNTVLAAAGETDLVHKYIDTIMSVTGVTSGYRLDVPIRIIKRKSGGA